MDFLESDITNVWHRCSVDCPGVPMEQVRCVTHNRAHLECDGAPLNTQAVDTFSTALRRKINTHSVVVCYTPCHNEALRHLGFLL